MTRYAKTSTGKYKIKGNVYPKLVGSRAQVWHGTAYKTTGDLTKHNLMKKSKNGRIISSKKHKSAKRDNRLVKHGYGAQKGKFGMVRLSKGRRTKRRRGGFNIGTLNPAPVSGMADDSMSTDALQLEAGMAGGRRRRRRSSRRRSRGGKRRRTRRTRRRRGGKRRRRSSRRRRGGFSIGTLNPAPVSGMADNSMSTDALQLEAGMAGGKRRRRSSSRRKRRGGRKSRRSSRRRRR